jgi:hypothetical protein
VATSTTTSCSRQSQQLTLFAAAAADAAGPHPLTAELNSALVADIREVLHSPEYEQVTD